jgi:hypothetical protein
MAHDQAAVGLNPGTVYWMDVSDASYLLHTRKNNENKGSQMGHTKKKLKSGFLLKWKPLYEIALEQGETDNFNQMITLTKQALRLVDS